MTESEIKLKEKIGILQMELKDQKQMYNRFYEKYRELIRVAGRIACKLDVLEKDRITWSIVKDNLDNAIYKSLGIDRLDCDPYMFRK